MQDQWGRSPDYRIPFSQSPSAIHPVAGVPYGEWWNKESIEFNKDIKMPNAHFEPILRKWATPEDFSLQHVDKHEREAKGLYTEQSDVDWYIAKKQGAYIEGKHLTEQPVLFDPFGGEGVQTIPPDETPASTSTAKENSTNSIPAPPVGIQTTATGGEMQNPCKRKKENGEEEDLKRENLANPSGAISMNLWASSQLY